MLKNKNTKRTKTYSSSKNEKRWDRDGTLGCWPGYVNFT